MPHVCILWGTVPEVGARTVRYDFDTDGERRTFLKGIEEGCTWSTTRCAAMTVPTGRYATAGRRTPRCLDGWSSGSTTDGNRDCFPSEVVDSRAASGGESGHPTPCWTR
jgi:hypothetical protein